MISQEVYKALASIVGADNISQDREIRQAYTLKDRGWHSLEARALGTIPEIVVMPASTEEVRQIVKVANRHKIGYTPMSTFWTPQSGPRFKDCLHIDLKRIDSLEIDSRNMNATVGSGVIYAQLQAEALKHGLYTVVPGGGSQVGVVPNHLCWGFSPLTYRAGLANRRIMGLEWVLPDGELLRLGSLASGSDPFWGEGIGPDLRGILRGNIGWLGSLGIVTKMCVRLMPFHTEKLVPAAIDRFSFLVFPENRMKWFNFTCPNKEAMVEFMYDIGQAEIGAALTRVPIAWRYIGKSASKEDFWDHWGEDQDKKREEVTGTMILRVLLIGYTSEKQLQYEEKVLMTIAEKHNAQHRRTRQVDGSWMQSGDAVSMWWLTGAFMSVTGQLDSLDCSIKTGEEFAKLKERYTPPLMEDYGDQGWFQVNDFGHSGYLEFLNYCDPNDTQSNQELIGEYFHIAGPNLIITKGALSMFAQLNSALSLDSPNYGPNYGKWARKVKQALDPNSISNPPGVLDAVDNLINMTPPLKAAKNW